MALTARLDSPLALYRKLERESYRAFHAPTPLHKADHFFNFCVTAASMRDYTLEHLKMVTPAQRRPYYDAWSKVPVLVAAAEIANSSKHFVLRDRSSFQPVTVKTKAIRMKRSTFADIYINALGETKVAEVGRPEVHITLSDKRILELSAFTTHVLEYWRCYLMSHGLKLRRQPFAQLTGHDA